MSLIVSVSAVLISALSLSLTIAWRVVDRRRAHVSAYFHRTHDLAKVRLPDGTTREAGYHIVISNQGPAAAHTIRLSARQFTGEPVELESLINGEFPIPSLPAGGKYPIPWLTDGTVPQGTRLFRLDLEWSDRSGHHTSSLQLRRGET